MKAIILAAGLGSRLRPLTNELPKTLVVVNGKSILDWQIDAYGRCGVEDITVVTGYHDDKFSGKNFRTVLNEDYQDSATLGSLLCCLPASQDVIVSYGDIIFSDAIVKRLAISEHDFTLMVEENWQGAYRKRSAHHPVERVELDSKGLVKRLGRNIPETHTSAEAIGLMKFSCQAIALYYALHEEVIAGTPATPFYTSRNYKNAQIGNLLLHGIYRKQFQVNTLSTQGQAWYEIDTLEDHSRVEHSLREAGTQFPKGFGEDSSN